MVQELVCKSRRLLRFVDVLFAAGETKTGKEISNFWLRQPDNLHSAQIIGVYKVRLTLYERVTRVTEKCPLSAVTGVRVQRANYNMKNMSFSLEVNLFIRFNSELCGLVPSSASESLISQSARKACELTDVLSLSKLKARK